MMFSWLNLIFESFYRKLYCKRIPNDSGLDLTRMRSGSAVSVRLPGTLTKRPRTKCPVSVRLQDFRNEAYLGQRVQRTLCPNIPWIKRPMNEASQHILRQPVPELNNGKLLVSQLADYTIYKHQNKFPHIANSINFILIDDCNIIHCKFIINILIKEFSRQFSSPFGAYVLLFSLGLKRQFSFSYFHENFEKIFIREKSLRKFSQNYFREISLIFAFRVFVSTLVSLWWRRQLLNFPLEKSLPQLAQVLPARSKKPCKQIKKRILYISKNDSDLRVMQFVLHSA
jgi:hypothetical protein